MNQPAHRFILSRQAGLSLIELMVAIAIGLMLLAGLTMLIVNQNSTRAELDKATRQIENGRYAMQLLQDDLQLAGYYGEFSRLGSAPGTLPNPCSTALADLEAAMPLSVQGYNSPAASPITGCLPVANHLAGTDILVIRRADTSTTTTASMTAGQPYIQTNLGGYIFGKSDNTSVFTLKKKDGVTAADLRKFMVNIYFVSPCRTPADASGVCSGTDDGGRPIPTLKRLTLTASGGAAQFSVTPLVEGIENFQVDYGMDTDSDGAPDGAYVNGSALTVSDWPNVMAVKVNVLARNTEPTTGYSDNKTYTLGTVTVSPPTDALAYKRHAFTELIRLINPSGRREQ